MKTVSINQLFQRSSKRVRFLGVATIILLGVIGFAYYFSVVSPSSARAFSGAGNGTSDEPFQITTCTQLQSIGDLANGYNYVFMNDIDCSDTINWNNGEGFEPISGYFSGEINGRNYEIKDLYINHPQKYAVGLFDTIGAGAIISNIKLTKSEVNNSRIDINGARSVGAVAGEHKGYKIVNVHSDLNVQSNGRASDAGSDDSGMSVGGLVGINRSYIELSSSSGNVSVADNDFPDRWASVGGLVGSIVSLSPETNDAHIKDSYATGNINSGSTDKTVNGRCGGLVGDISVTDPNSANGTEVSYSYSTGSVTCDKPYATDLSIGGFTGAIVAGNNVQIAPIVNNNFTTSNVTTTAGSGFYGIYYNGTEGIPETAVANTDLANNANAFDASRTGKSSCGNNNNVSCEAVNIDNSNPSYFSSANDTGYYNNWNQTAFWELTDTYPAQKTMTVRPDAPVNLNVVRNIDDFEISWTAPADEEGRFSNLRYYEVYYKDIGNNGNWQKYEPGDNQITDTSAILTGLTIPGNYSFKVRAVSDFPGYDVIGLYSASLNFATGMPATAPLNVQVTPNAKSANVTWEAVEGATAYEVQYRKAGTETWSTGGSTDQLSIKIGVLVPGTNYEIRVTAKNIAGVGPWSELAATTTTAQVSYNVSNCQQLQDVNNDLEGVYTQTANIDCSGIPSFAVIGGTNDTFIGSYDGKGFTISNVTIASNVEAEDTSWRGVGLFGIIVNGDLQNITVKDSTIVGNYKLDESIDADGNGLPDAPATPQLPAVEPIGDVPTSVNEAGERVQTRVQEVAGISQQVFGQSLGAGQQLGFNITQFPNFAVGGVIGAAIGAGNYNNLKVINTTVQGSIAGGVIGATIPIPDLRILAVASADDVLTALAVSSEPVLLTNLQSSGNVNGFVGGGIVGVGMSSLGGLAGLDGELIVDSNTSSATVNANFGGGIMGMSLSPSTFSILPSVFSYTAKGENPQGNDDFLDAADRTLNRQDIIIKNSTSSGVVSTCDAPSEVRTGSLGGIVGLSTGTVIQSSTSSAQISACSSAPDMGLSYGGSMGGLSGLMVSSRIVNSNASGKISATQDGVDGQYGNDSVGYVGSVGGLTGIFIGGGSDTDGNYAIANSHSTGNIEIGGNYALISFSGGISGIFLGSGTIQSSYSTSDIYTSTAQQNVGALSISGGLTGLSIGIDAPYLAGITTALNFDGSNAVPSHGVVIDDSYATGDVLTQKNGKSGMLAVTGGMSGLIIGGGSISNSHATGVVSSTTPNKFSLGKIPEAPPADPADDPELNQTANFVGEVILGSNYGTTISGGLVGSTYGVDLPLIGSTQLAVAGLMSPDKIKTTQGITVSNSYAKGDVDANIAGGLMGSAELRTQIDKAYADGNVNGEVVGGLVGQSGLVSTTALGGVMYLAATVTGGFNNPDGSLAQVGTIFDTNLKAVGPVEISNTYATGNISTTPYEVDLTAGFVEDESAVEQKDKIVPVRLPTIAGGLVGLYMDPGGSVTNSYATGNITVAPLPERGENIKVADIPSFAGGIFGIHVAIPVPSVEEILTDVETRENIPPQVGLFMDTPQKVENVFSTSSMNLTDKTFTGGTSGLFISPMDFLNNLIIGNDPANYERDKVYTVKNVYFDGSKVKVEGCNGPFDQASGIVRGLTKDSFIPGSEGANVIPSIPEGEDLTPEGAGIESAINNQFPQTSCQFVNNNNEQPNYFKNNKVNGPLSTWNFNNVWVIQKDDYPKFVAAATTTTPNVPGSPTTNGASPTPTVPGPVSTSTPNNIDPAIPTDTSVTTVDGFLRKQIQQYGLVSNDTEQVKGLKTYLANVPVFIARSIPYTLIMLLLIIATMYSLQALRQYRELSKYHKNILRIITTKESVDNYLAITTHYLNTPVAIMNGSVELLLSLKKITATRANALTNKISKFAKASEQLLVANQVSGAQAANDEKILKQDQTNPLKVKEVWIPATIALGLIVLANVLFIYADVFNTSVFRIGIEIGLFILSVLLVALAYRYRDYLESTKLLAKEQLRLESELYKKREAFIPEATKVTSEHLESLQITSKTLEKIPEAKLFFNGLAMLEGINKGLQNLEKFAKFNNDPPLFDITTYARKSVEKYSEKAKEKNVVIETKVDTGLVSRVQPEEIRQLVDSLLENAVKYSDKDTSVTLSIYRRFNKIVISVSDKGVGISEHKLPSLLKPFSRGTDSMQYNYEGIGLGLYSDKIIVDKLGGTISITSKLGEGTTTTVAIPTNYSAKENVPVLIMPDSVAS